jgi:hypothetical protein
MFAALLAVHFLSHEPYAALLATSVPALNGNFIWVHKNE